MSEKTFSFKPDVFAPDGNGGLTVDKTRSNPYVLLKSHTQGTIFYTPKTNQYWIAEGKEVSQERFESHFLPYLRWKYDRIVDGVNEFPPSPENILIKRKELIEAASERGELIDQQELIQATSPVQLTNSAAFEARLNKEDVDERLIKRLNHSKV